MFHGLVLVGSENAPATDAEPQPPLLPAANVPLVVHALRALSRSAVRQVTVLGADDHVRAAVRALQPTGLELAFADDALDGEDLRDVVVIQAETFVGRHLQAAVADFRRTRSGTILVATGGAAPVAAVIGEEALDAALATGAGSILGGLDRATTGVEVRRHHGTWRWNGRRDGLLEANRLALDALEDGDPGPTAPDVKLQGRVLVAPDAELEATTIRGPAVIGPGARISHSYVGPYTSIGEGAELTGAEIEHSIVFPGAVVSHVGRRLESSVLGDNAVVARTFEPPDALRLLVGAGSSVMLT